MAVPDLREEDFPAPSREFSGNVGDVPTQITRLDFSDKILLTISQRGRLSQWVLQHPLLSPSSLEMHRHSRGTNRYKSP